ncbi:hypothetical protein HAX54_018905 [Datura stramonium]|uniref:Protein kinase domain-containing protein n=1 Tax=Datura stramonium TaxID=4076 RepID=A0ABS8RMS6_DATST|nr:hypothetical protein [Datura stramonium]
MYWKKLKVLGAGSYGTVSLATPLMEHSLTLFAAVKSAEVARSSSLQVEGQILDMLRGSEYVVECFGEDISIENGKHTYNLLLEYAAGGTLHDLIQKSNTKSKAMIRESEAAYYAFQLLRGISHVHRRGFIHCDLKPDNILVFPRGHGIVDVKLADFGLSLRSTGENETHTYWDSSNKCRHHRGTLLYASPESVACGIHGKAVDIWGLGCIVVEMITGRPLWCGYKNNDELELKIVHEEPEIPDNISNVAKDFLGKCLDRDHKWRWMAEMLLNHPFIKINAKKIHPFGHAGCKTWVSTKHLFSTT